VPEGSHHTPGPKANRRDNLGSAEFGVASVYARLTLAYPSAPDGLAWDLLIVL